MTHGHNLWLAVLIASFQISPAFAKKMVEYHCFCGHGKNFEHEQELEDLEFDQPKYEKRKDACCLKQDLGSNWYCEWRSQQDRKEAEILTCNPPKKPKSLKKAPMGPDPEPVLHNGKTPSGN